MSCALDLLYVRVGFFLCDCVLRSVYVMFLCYVFNVFCCFVLGVDGISCYAG